MLGVGCFAGLYSACFHFVRAEAHTENVVWKLGKVLFHLTHFGRLWVFQHISRFRIPAANMLLFCRESCYLL